MNIKKVIGKLVFFLVLLPSLAIGSNTTGETKVAKIHAWLDAFYVQVENGNNNPSACPSVDWIEIKTSHGNYNSIVSMLISSFSMNTKVEIFTAPICTSSYSSIMGLNVWK